MSNRGKIFIILLVFLIFVSLSLAAATYYFLQEEKVQTDAVGKKLEDLSTEYRVTLNRLQETKDRTDQLEKELLESKDQIEFLNTQLNKERKSKQDILNQTGHLKKLLKQKEQTEKELQGKLTDSQKQIKNLQGQLNKTQSFKIDDKIKETVQANLKKVELGQIVVGGEVPGKAEARGPLRSARLIDASLEGKILVVNKEYDFAVIDLGSLDGVRVNDIFSVFDQDKYIGEIKTEKVHESMSAAVFLSGQVKDKIKEGDRVLYKDK